jgi:hypothetical protein
VSEASDAPDDVTARLRQLAELSDLSPEGRARGKVDMSAPAVMARLREQAALRDACLAWAKRAPAADTQTP